MNSENDENKIGLTDGAPESAAAPKKRVAAVKRVSKKKEPAATAADNAEESGVDPSTPLRLAADRIATLLCELSGDSSLFVTASGEAPSRRLDTKALKEFSGVLKEMSAVMTELHGDGETERRDGVRIEFSDEASELGS